MVTIPFAFSTAGGEKKALAVLADGVYALTVEGDPNSGPAEREVFYHTSTHLHPKFGQWPVCEYWLRCDVRRLWHELDSMDRGRTWNAERHQRAWDRLQD